MTPEESLQLAELVDADNGELDWSARLLLDLANMRFFVAEFHLAESASRQAFLNGFQTQGDLVRVFRGRLIKAEQLLRLDGLDFSAEVAALVAT